MTRKGGRLLLLSGYFSLNLISNSKTFEWPDMNIRPKPPLFENLKAIGSGFLHAPLIAYILMYQGAVLASTWFLILAKDMAIDMQWPVAAFGVRALMGAAMLMLFTTLIRRKRLLFWLWRGAWLIGIAAALLLALKLEASMLFITAAAVVVIVFKSAATVATIDSFTHLTAGSLGRSRIVIFMIIGPVLVFLLSTLTGWLTEIYRPAVFVICTLIGITVLIMTYNQNHLEKIDAERGKLPAAAIWMTVLCAVFNLFNIIISKVILPLYILEKTDGDFSQFGFWFGLLALVMLAGKLLRNRVSDKIDIKLHFWILFTSVVAVPLCNILWGIGYETLWLPLIAIVIRQIIMPVWNAMFNVVLKDHTDNEAIFADATRQINVVTRLMMALGYFISAVIFINRPDLYQAALIGLSVIMLLLLVPLLILFNRKFIQPSFPETS